MAGPGGSHQEVAARDDAHLESFGIIPELQRTLGFLSISLSRSATSASRPERSRTRPSRSGGRHRHHLGLATGHHRPDVRGANFAELSSHFPVAGSIYQWSKRLSNSTLGWFTGWFYFWAGVVTVTAVAATVPLVLSTIMGFDLRERLAGPGPRHVAVHRVRDAHLDDHHQHDRCSPAGVDQQHRRRGRDPRHGGVRAPCSCSSPTTSRRRSCSTLRTPARSPTATTFPVFLVGMFMALFVVLRLRHGGHIRRGDASMPAARPLAASCRRSGCPGSWARSS